MFARNKQPHDCAPGLSLEAYFSTGPDHERPVYEAVMQHLEAVGPVHADIVSVGIFLKNPRKFAELRPKQKWVAIGFSLSRRAAHPTITRKLIAHSSRFWHVANVGSVDDLDDQLLGHLIEAYEDVAC